VTSLVISEERGVRRLHFGSTWVQGAMRIARPWSLEIEYTRQLMAPLLLRPTAWPAPVLQVGLGAGSVTRFLYRHRPRSRLTVVEILPEVVAAARQHFRLPDDPARLSVVVGDGHDYLAGTNRRFDLIVVDGYDAEGRPGMLASAPFYLNCQARLARSGMAALNLLDHRGGLGARLRRLREAFEGQVLVLPRCEAGNTVVLAGAGCRDLKPEALRARALELKRETGLDLRPVVERLAEASA
jgi:spermidine synthase